jgi:hypothetical protein
VCFYRTTPLEQELELGVLDLYDIQRDQQGLKLLAVNDSKIFPKYENFLGVSVGTRCML